MHYLIATAQTMKTTNSNSFPFNKQVMKSLRFILKRFRMLLTLFVSNPTEAGTTVLDKQFTRH